MMGVPISFVMKHNPAQFEILGIDRYIKGNPHPGRRQLMVKKNMLEL